jgi:hypothetical protein
MVRSRPRLSPAALLFLVACASAPAPAVKPPLLGVEKFAIGSHCRKPRPDDVCRQGYRLICDEAIEILRCERVPDEEPQARATTPQRP